MNIQQANYPIYLDNGWWVFGGFPVECGYYGARKFPCEDLVFGSPQKAKSECARRNLAKVTAAGIADEKMPWLGREDAPTYRQFYVSEIAPELIGEVP